MSKRPNKPQSDNSILTRLRVRIAVELEKNTGHLRQNITNLEMCIGSHAPSVLLKGFPLSDYPFVGCRYMSVEDGHVYVVAGETEDENGVLAYRIGFIRSIFTSQGGIAVGITEDAWMRSKMIMFSITYASLSFDDKGLVKHVDGDRDTRRVYPIKKAHVYLKFLLNKIGGIYGTLFHR